MQKKSVIGGILRWAALGTVVAAAFVFTAPFFLEGTFLYAASMGLGAAIGGVFGAVKTVAQNASHDRTERTGHQASVRNPSPAVQLSAPAPAKDIHAAPDAGMSFVAREEARRAAPPQQKTV